jgi:site-specific recombinase XerC
MTSVSSSLSASNFLRLSVFISSSRSRLASLTPSPANFLCQLFWGMITAQVDLERRSAWIHADQSKTGRPIGIPPNREAVLLRGLIGNHKKYVFTYNRKPVRHCNTKVWRRALTLSGIEDFRWHDMRHTWASWHVQNGTPMHVLQELGGWSDIQMVQRYAHLSPEHLAPYAETLCRLQPVPTLSTTNAYQR